MKLKLKWYLVTVRVGGMITNRLVQASSPEEAEKKVREELEERFE